jgi:hypothetical protein
MICANIHGQIGFPFSFACDDGNKGRYYPMGGCGAGLGLVKGLIFGGSHVLLLKFYSSLTHQKVVEGVR